MILFSLSISLSRHFPRTAPLLSPLFSPPPPSVSRRSFFPAGRCTVYYCIGTRSQRARCRVYTFFINKFHGRSKVGLTARYRRIHVCGITYLTTELDGCLGPRITTPRDLQLRSIKSGQRPRRTFTDRCSQFQFTASLLSCLRCYTILQGFNDS